MKNVVCRLSLKFPVIVAVLTETSLGLQPHLIAPLSKYYLIYFAQSIYRLVMTSQ